MRETPSIRPMLASDLPQILRIENLVFHPPWPEEAFSETFCTQSWVICEAEILRGYIMYHVIPDEAVILNFAIDPDVWRQGLGTRLFEHTFVLVQEQGVNTVYLDVRCSNMAARKLYEKHGFEVLGLRKDYYSEPLEDATVMVRRRDG